MRELISVLVDVLAPDAANLRLSPERSTEIYLLAVTGARMLRLRMATLGTPDPGDLEELIEIFLPGALRGEHQ